MDVRQKINDIANGLEEYSKRNRKLKIRIMDYVHYFRGASKQIAEIVRWAITYKNGNTKDYWYSAGMGAPWSYRSVNKELDEKFKSNIKNAN